MRKIIRLKSAFLRNYWRLRGLKLGKNVIFQGVITVRGNPRQISVADNVEFQSHVILSINSAMARLAIGKNATICDGVIISCAESISIGDDTMLSAYTYVVDNNHGSQPGSTMKEQPLEAGPILIGDDVWIGTHSVVTKGVSIGSGSIVAAGAIVNKSVGSGEVVGGVPARVIRKRTALS